MLLRFAPQSSSFTVSSYTIHHSLLLYCSLPLIPFTIDYSLVTAFKLYITFHYFNHHQRVFCRLTIMAIIEEHVCGFRLFGNFFYRFHELFQFLFRIQVVVPDFHRGVKPTRISSMKTEVSCVGGQMRRKWQQTFELRFIHHTVSQSCLSQHIKIPCLRPLHVPEFDNTAILLE